MWMQDCGTCHTAKAEGLHAWMRHLTDEHVLPTEWPSSRAAKLTGALALRPYTTITESKKKRRKDSIPRPLNSFMLFAQHVRRNVLRVFSDASNSVISQQLGDLWRTVPHEYRNQYDEEANRLVKIHQLEFPNYKYQPKKRQPVHSSGCGSCGSGPAHSNGGIGKNSQHSVTGTTAVDTCKTTIGIRMAADYSKSCNRSPNGVSAGDYRCSSDRISSQVSASFRSRLSSNGSSSTSYPSFGYRQATVEDRVQMASAKVSDSTLRLISPAKQTGKTVAHNRAETKPSLVASTTSFRSSATSLSSVLPPLLAPSSRAVTVINADIFHQAHHNQGSCDSAYASGINSSSSSSASSPAVGDLLSPMKPNCGAVNVAKSSPVRRKIQFVPIRPQSQQLYSSRTQPTRQRFLSATSGSCNLALNRSSFSDQQILVFEAPTHSGQVLDPTQVSELETHRVHRLVAPVYVRLGPDTNGSSEEVLLALPPGTTIIQTLGDVTQLTTSNSSGLQQQMTHRRILHTHATKPPTMADSQKIHTLRPAKSMHVSNKREEPYTPVTSSADYSPTPYSSGSSPTSSWSPLSGDVFLPLSHMNVTVAEPEVKCKVEDFPSFYSAYSKVEDTTFQPESSDSTSEYSGLDAANQFEIDTGQSTMEFRQQGLEYLECNIHQTTMENVGNSCAVWSSPPMGRESEEMRGTVGQNREFVKAACNPSMAPLAVDIIQSFPGAAQSEMRQSDIGPNTATDDTDFPMANEDNFDSSFDAMMRSIDITTFLPGTFAENEDSMDDYDTQNSESEPRNGSVESASQELVEAGHSAAMPHDRSYSTETAPLIDIDDMLTSLDHCPQLTHRKQRTTAVTYLTEQIPSYSRYANEPVLDGLKSVDMRHLINTGDGATGYSQHSPLSDLDSLDKSSLFVIKPDWSLRVCE